MRIDQEALTFDDVLLVPAYSEVLPREVDLSTRLTRNIRLNLPLMSAAMDTVTEARLAITIAQEGGIGIVHKNMSAAAQAREVLRVKKFESGVISDPITVTPDKSIREVIDLTRARNSTCSPSRGVSRSRWLLVRNIAQRTCALASFSVKYQWPDDGRAKFESSPSTQSAGSAPSSRSFASRLSRETL